MKTLTSKFAMLACFMALFAITSCTAETDLPQPEPSLQEKALVEGATTDETPEGTASCCAVVGSPQLMAQWQNDIDDVLGCCHTETLADDFPNCNWYPWGNTNTNTINKTIAYQYPASQIFPASQVNVLIGYMADLADTDRPSGSWLIHDIQFVPYFGCTAGYKCFRLKIQYKRMLCALKGTASPI